MTVRPADLAYIDLRHSQTRFLTTQQDLNKSCRTIYIIIVSGSQSRQTLHITGVHSLRRNAFFHAIPSPFLREADVLACGGAGGRRNLEWTTAAGDGKRSLCSAQLENRKLCDVKALTRTLAHSEGLCLYARRSAAHRGTAVILRSSSPLTQNVRFLPTVSTMK